MSGYIIAVHYTNNSVAQTVLLGVDTGMFPDQATAVTAAKSTVMAMQTAKGQTPLSMVALVSATR